MSVRRQMGSSRLQIFGSFLYEETKGVRLRVSRRVELNGYFQASRTMRAFDRVLFSCRLSKRIIANEMFQCHRVLWRLPVKDFRAVFIRACYFHAFHLEFSTPSLVKSILNLLELCFGKPLSERIQQKKMLRLKQGARKP